MLSDIKRSFWKFFDRMNYFYVYRDRRGEMTGEEIVKIILVAILIVVVVSGIIYIVWGKGGKLLAGIGEMFRSGA